MKENNNNFLAAVEKAKQRLAAGEKPEDVFDDCEGFQDGFAAVKLNRKWNYIDSHGNIISNKWFDWCGYFHEGFTEVKLNDKYYHLRKDGVLCGYNTKEPISPDIDYKKKYEEALQRARVVNPGTADHNIVTAIFPELKVSEDKQSKKWILEYLYDGLRKSDEQFKDQFKSAIDWFEKQSVEKPDWSEEDEKMLQQIIQFLISFSEEYEVDLNDKLIWLKSIKEKMKGEK